MGPMTKLPVFTVDNVLCKHPHVFVPLASSFVAAIQRGWPPDWADHSEQEVSHAPWGRLAPGTKSKQGFIHIKICPHWEDGVTSDLIVHLSHLCVQVVGGKMTETGRLGAFITKVKKGSLADVVGHLRAGTKHRTCCSFAGAAELQTVMLSSRNACEINLCRDISMYLSSLQAWVVCLSFKLLNAKMLNICSSLWWPTE